MSNPLDAPPERAEVPLPADETLRMATPRLRLAPLVVDDTDDLFPVLDDVRLHHFTGGAPLTREQLRQRFAIWQTRRSPDGRQVWLNWTVRLAQGESAVGYVQATVVGDLASIAYVIGTQWAGQGIATEAVLEMCEALRVHFGIRRLDAQVNPAHLASVGVARHAGLTPTGELDGDGEELWTCSKA